MVAHRVPQILALSAAGMLLISCSDGSAPPTAVLDGGAYAPAQHFQHASAAVLASTTLEPFTFRAPLDPYRIHQLPDFLMHSTTRSDIVMQRSVFAPGPGAWHIHPGISFVYVIEGEIKLERYTGKNGCVETPVYTAGSAYSEGANEVHRAVVVSVESAVLLVTRFNIPVGGPITIPAAAPDC